MFGCYTHRFTARKRAAHTRAAPEVHGQIIIECIKMSSIFAAAPLCKHTSLLSASLAGVQWKNEIQTTGWNKQPLSIQLQGNVQQSSSDT